MKLSLQGVTIVAASGDDGVADYGARSCTAGQVSTANNCACKADSSSYIDSDGISISQAGNKWTGMGYFPSFPASCPYITAVGGTQGPESNTTEIAASTSTGAIITTGGGFSIFYIQKPWQTALTLAYFAGLSTANAPTSGYNIMGSGYPDVSLVGVNYEIYFSGSTELVSGTSASCPVFAAMGTSIFHIYLECTKSILLFICLSFLLLHSFGCSVDYQWQKIEARHVTSRIYQPHVVQQQCCLPRRRHR